MSGYDDKLHMALTVDLSAEEAAKHYAREFVTDLIEDAGHHLERSPTHYEQLVRDLAEELYYAGYDPRPDDDQGVPVAWTFASPGVYHELKDELGARVRLADEPPVRISGYLPVWADPVLPDGTVVMLHRDAIVPAPAGDVERPWVVKSPAGVGVAEVDTDE